MARQQYGISAPVLQTSFLGETIGREERCELFSKATQASQWANVTAQDRRGSTSVSIVLRKSVRFFIINIWKMVWTLLASYPLQYGN